MDQMIENIFAIAVIFFIWIVAPCIIIHSKGRRWWAWLPLVVIFPMGFLVIAMFMHGVDKNGKSSIS